MDIQPDIPIYFHLFFFIPPTGGAVAKRRRGGVRMGLGLAQRNPSVPKARYPISQLGEPPTGAATARGILAEFSKDRHSYLFLIQTKHYSLKEKNFYFLHIGVANASTISQSGCSCGDSTTLGDEHVNGSRCDITDRPCRTRIEHRFQVQRLLDHSCVGQV